MVRIDERGDFLQHTEIFVVNFERVFDDNSASVRVYTIRDSRNRVPITYRTDKDKWGWFCFTNDMNSEHLVPRGHFAIPRVCVNASLFSRFHSASHPITETVNRRSPIKSLNLYVRRGTLTMAQSKNTERVIRIEKIKNTFLNYLIKTTPQKHNWVFLLFI